MKKVFDSNRDKLSKSEGLVRLGKSFVIKNGSLIEFDADLSYSTKVFIKIIASCKTGPSSILVSIGGKTEPLKVGSRQKKELSLVFELDDFLGSTKIKIESKERRSKVVLDRIIVGTEFENKSANSFHYSLDGYRNRVAFIVPYSIYGGAEVYLKNFLEHYKDLDYRVICLGNNIISSYIPKERVQMSSLSRLSEEIKAGGFNIVCFYNSKRVYDKLSQINKTFKLVEIYHSDFEWSDSMSRLKRHNVDWIIRISNDVGNHIEGVEKISSVVKPSIDFRRFVPKSRDKSLVGTVARLSNEKNLDYLIKLKRKMPDKKFVVFGDGSNEIKSRLESSGISVKGFCNNMEDYYNFGAFVLPSNKEGLPLTIIEALSCNIPCFAKDTGGISKVLSGMGYNWELTGDPNSDSEIIYESINNNFNFRNKIQHEFDSRKTSSNFLNTILYSDKINKVWSTELDPNKYFDGIYCINLDNRKDKWAKSERVFNRWGLKVERFSAKSPRDSEVDYYWKKLNYLEPNDSIRRSKKEMTKIGEVGCFLSHFSIIKKAKEEGKKKILIFEDDVIFRKTFDKDIRFLKILQDDWAMLYFGASQYDWKGVRPHSNKFYYSKNTDGTFAYAINLDYYDQIYNALSKVSHPIDWDYRVGVQNVLPKKCYTFFPNLVIADVSDSDIRGGRSMAEQAKILKWSLENYEM